MRAHGAATTPPSLHTRGVARPGVQHGVALAARRTLILDSDPLAAKVLSLVLTEAGHAVTLIKNPVAALNEAADGDTRAVITETDLPGMTGFQLCSELRGRRYQGPIVFLSRDRDPGVRVRAFDCGADDFIQKPFDPHELLARIASIARRCERGLEMAAGNVIKVGDVELVVGELRVTVGDRRPVLLTPTEMRLLETLMRNHSMTLTRDVLIDRTWPNDVISDTNRVDVYVGRLRRKIEPDPAHPQYVHTVRGVGYAFRTRRAPERVVALEGRAQTSVSV